MPTVYAICLNCNGMNEIKTVCDKVLCKQCGKIVKCGMFIGNQTNWDLPNTGTK